MRQKYKVYGGEWNKKLNVRSSKLKLSYMLKTEFNIAQVSARD